MSGGVPRGGATVVPGEKTEILGTDRPGILATDRPGILVTDRPVSDGPTTRLEEDKIKFLQQFNMIDRPPGVSGKIILRLLLLILSFNVRI